MRSHWLHEEPSVPCLTMCQYSHSLKNLARQLLHHSDKSAFTGSQRPICQSCATVGVRGFWENGCMWLWLSPVMPGAIALGTLSVPWSQVRDDLEDILTSVHIGKCSHSQTCMFHFSAKHHMSPGLSDRDVVI